MLHHGSCIGFRIQGENEDLLLVYGFIILVRDEDRTEGPPEEKEKAPWPDTSLPESVFTPGFNLNSQRTPAGDPFRNHRPNSSHPPPAGSFFGTFDRQMDRAAREGHQRAPSALKIGH